MRRRQFILTMGVATLYLHRVLAQSSGKHWLIGFIAHEYEKMYDPFFEGLRDLGYMEGKNTTFERRYARGQAERFLDFAKELVALDADVIVTVTTPAVLALKSVTTTIPIVIPNAIDPVGTGLVASLAHPGGNVTGGTLLQAELSTKRLQLLKEIVPHLTRAGLFWNVGNPAYARAWLQAEDAARVLAVALQRYEVKHSTDFEAAFSRITGAHPDALLVLEDALTIGHRKDIIDFALRQRLPTSFFATEAVEAGGLMSYGSSWAKAFRRGAQIVDKILKGTKPSDLPVEEPTEFELAINLKTAKALSLTVPQSLLARADKVVE